MHSATQKKQKNLCEKVILQRLINLIAIALEIIKNTWKLADTTDTSKKTSDLYYKTPLAFSLAITVNNKDDRHGRLWIHIYVFFYIKSVI